MGIVPGEVSAVDEFAARLLSMLDHDARQVFTSVNTRTFRSFFICGIASHVKTDVCVVWLALQERLLSL